MELLKDLAETLQVCQSLEEAYRVITAFAARLFPHSTGAINLISQSRNLVERVAWWGEPNQLGQAVFAPEQCWAIRRARATQHTDSLGLDCEHLRQKHAPGICVPMLSKGEAVGVIDAMFDQSLTNEQQQLIGMFADTIALAITNLRLYEKLHFQSIRDGLTGLYNRRFLEESLDYELRRAIRLNKPLCVVMLDMDHFKRFNDTFGHGAGDILLKEFGQMLIGQSRQSDILCRYGGEEFALILPETTTNEALDYADRLRQQVKQLNIIHHDRALGTVTISVGIAAFPINGQNPHSLIEAADKALYTAKHAGRDRAIVAAPNSPRE
jgi:diguanylate cyclase (GGDEF)-like protein